MFGTPTNPANAYAALSTESAVHSADPHRLILLLFEGTENALALAHFHAEQGNITARGNAISKAIDIITNGLKASLDIQQGGELAERLAALYDYMASRLLWANMKNDIPTIEEVQSLLGEIHEAWRLIEPGKQQK
ncbi:flagellar export chaperone FliS [Azovibrio restrictus]|jgi:flagellar protein FliS|uniref:flagellar export chaperone FliS n=1 Tax=Azovibrio restrictus TaxID=146938 RepID=UPI0026F34608|nr:flagellar export chaperone FliS [Azovibrio restrictus]